MDLRLQYLDLWDSHAITRRKTLSEHVNLNPKVPSSYPVSASGLIRLCPRKNLRRTMYGSSSGCFPRVLDRSVLWVLGLALQLTTYMRTSLVSQVDFIKSGN